MTQQLAKASNNTNLQKKRGTILQSTLGSAASRSNHENRQWAPCRCLFPGKKKSRFDESTKTQWFEKWIKEVANASLSFTQIQMQQISMRYLRKYKLTKWQCVEGTAFFTETAFLSTQIIKLFVRISCSTRHWTGIASVSWYLWN